MGLLQAGRFSPPIFGQQLTLCQPRGQIMPITVLRAPTPPDFQDFRRPCLGYLSLVELRKCKNCLYHRNNFGRFMQPLPKWFCFADLF